MKIKSILAIDKGIKRGLKKKYEEIYKDAYVWLYKKSDGVHSVVYGQIKDKIKNKNVLDVGCGAGRLSIMMAFVAKSVDAFDFSETAISIAKKNAECCGARNVNFFVDEIEKFSPKSSKRYDVITLIGVLEHVEDPITVLTQLGNLMVKNGYLVIGCPNFLNFRGDTYMTLLKLFGLPMSLADLRQIDYTNIQDWTKATGFKLKKTIGTIYDFAFGDKATRDMIKRVPLAIQDKQLKIDVDYPSYNLWLESRAENNKIYLNFLEKKGFLKKIKKQVNIRFSRARNIDKKLWKKMREYIHEDLENGPFYSDVVPICYQGGECIYILKREKT